MEALFENRYTANQRMIRSFARGASFSQRFFFRFSIAGMGICLLAIAYCLLFLPGDWDSILSPAVSLLLCAMLFFFPNLTARILYRNTLRLHGGAIPETVVRFSDEITMEEGTLSIRFEYRQVTKIRETKLLYVLMLGKDSGIILDKKGFSIGDLDSFRSFILKQCPSVKK